MIQTPSSRKPRACKRAAIPHSIAKGHGVRKVECIKVKSHIESLEQWVENEMSLEGYVCNEMADFVADDMPEVARQYRNSSQVNSDSRAEKRVRDIAKIIDYSSHFYNLHENRKTFHIDDNY